MALITLTPTPTRMLARATVATTQVYPGLGPAQGGVYPISLAAYDLDEYRMMAGWPTSIPDFDVQAHSSVSCDGEVVSYREEPSLAPTSSMLRFIADRDETYTSNQWLPYVGNLDARFATSDDYAPTYVQDYEYRVGSERFYANAVNFDSDAKQHMWGDLNPVINGAAGYSVVMAVNLHSVFGDTTKTTAGIWCPGLATGPDSNFLEDIDAFMSVTLRGSYLYLETEQTPATKSLPVSDLLASSRPVYLAFCFARPNATLYAATGPSRVRKASTFTGSEVVGLSGNVVLGRTNGTTANCVDMAVLDLGIYPDKLTGTQVRAEIAKLSAVYGGDQ